MKQNFKKYNYYFPKPKSQKILNNYWNFIKSHSNDSFTKNDYTEIHHCVPRAYLKTQEEINDKDNLIKLKGKDHYTAHLLLWLAFRDRQSAFAFFSMNCFKRQNDWKINAILYEELRREISKHLSIFQRGKESHNKGRIYMTNEITNKHKLVKAEDFEQYLIDGWIMKGPPVPEYQKQWISEHYKGKNNPIHKHPCKDETKLKMSESMSNLIWINDGSTSKRIRKEELPVYLSCGFTEGRLKYSIKRPYDFSGKRNPVYGSKWVTDGNINKFIKKSELEQFLVDNPQFYIGMTDNRNHKTSKRSYKRDSHWYTDGYKNYLLNETEYNELSTKINLIDGRFQFNKINKEVRDSEA